MAILTPEEDIPFLCLDCGVSTAKINEYYMVHQGVWLQANPEYYGMLCIGCLETRLGRTLTKADFIDALVNVVDGGWDQSPRLVNRLTN